MKALPDTLQAWLDYQGAIHLKNIDLGLARAQQVWQQMGAPTPASQIITIAGTNGKGSSVALLQAILQQAGYRVGAYTSPHIQRYNERVCIDGQLATDESLCRTFAQIEQVRADIPLTYFEFGTLAALWLFSQSQLDIVLLEVGLGGRLDAVNIIDADIALITCIALDHTDWLGDNTESIGAEKAGIMRAGKPVVYATPDMPKSIAQRAQDTGAILLRLGADYQYQQAQDGWHWQGKQRTRSSLPIPAMRGAIQLQNAAAVLQVIECLQDIFPVDQQAIRQGLLSAQIAGRLQVVQRKARWVLDVAHNPQAMQVLTEQISDMYVPGKIVVILGVLQDKLNADLFQPLSPRVDEWFVLDLTQESRGASAQTVILELQKYTDKPVYPQTDTVDKLCQQVEKETSEQDLVIVCGSFLTVAAVVAWLGKQGAIS